MVALLAERVPGWLGSEDRTHQMEEELAARQSTQDQIDQVHRQLAQLVESQSTAMACPRRTRPSRAVEHSRRDRRPYPPKLTAQMVAVQDDLKTVKTDVAQEVQSGMRVAVSAVEADRDVVRQDLQSIKSVNETLIKQVALLESRNRELHARLALTSLEVAKANAATAKPTVVARNDPPEGNAGADRRCRSRMPFAKRIDRPSCSGSPSRTAPPKKHRIWFRKSTASKGPMKSGWYSVEVNLPNPEPPGSIFGVRETRQDREVGRHQQSDASGSIATISSQRTQPPGMVGVRRTRWNQSLHRAGTCRPAFSSNPELEGPCPTFIRTVL